MVHIKLHISSHFSIPIVRQCSNPPCTGSRGRAVIAATICGRRRHSERKWNSIRYY
uniref:Uncharacterized protein n=1 Tax=Hyaloperonospora arabidopsidis (strain Emoy2) TaxID=559515 RepID=M4BI43_HYAAE